MRKTRSNKAFSLVELMIGTALTVIIIMGGVYVFKTLAIGITDSNMDVKANQKLWSVGEHIRYEAASRFDFMDETNAERTGTFDKNIKVFSTIGPADPVTRSRRVSLVARWDKGGVEQTKTHEFQVAQTKAKVAGATLIARVVSIHDPSISIQDVKFTIAGEDAQEVTYTSNENGYVRIEGVKLGTDMKLTVDGEPAKAYFVNGTPTYKDVFTIDETRAGELNDTYFTDPIKIYPPAVLSGKITDSKSGDPVANVEIAIYEESTIFANNGNSTLPKVSVMSDSLGAYSKKFLPGSYLVYMMSSGEYAAPTQSSDWWQYHLNGSFDPNKTIRVSLTSGNSKVKNYAPIRKGAMKGMVYGISVLGNNYVLTGPATAGVKFKFYRSRKKSYLYPTAQVLDFGDSNNWTVLFKDIDLWSRGNVDYAETNSNGEFALDPFVPAAVHPGYDYSNQYSLVRVRPFGGSHDSANVPTWTVDPYVPVLIKGPTAFPPWDKDQVKMVAYEHTSDLNNEDIANGSPALFTPQGSTGSDWDYRVFTNRYANSTNPDNQNDVSLFVLERAALANVKGILVDGAGVKYPNKGEVKIVFANGEPYGGLTFQFFSPSKMVYTKKRNVVSATVAGNNAYDFMLSGSYPTMERTILPTIGNDKVKLVFTESGVNEWRIFMGKVEAFRRIAGNGNAADFQQIPAHEIDITNFRILCNRSLDYYYKWETNTTISDGNFAFSQQALRLGRVVETEPFSIPPGQTTTKNIVVDGAAVTDTFENYRLKALGDVGENWLFDRWTSSNENGEPYTYNAGIYMYTGQVLRIVETGVTGQIYGKVTNNGVPVVGAHVKIYRELYKDWVDLGLTVANTGPGGDYQYVMDHVKFYPDLPTNITIKIEDSRFQIAQKSITAYNAYTAQHDFILTSASGGGGGQDGEGGL